jgi:hypothetical protein
MWSMRKLCHEEITLCGGRVGCSAHISTHLQVLPSDKNCLLFFIVINRPRQNHPSSPLSPSLPLLLPYLPPPIPPSSPPSSPPYLLSTLPFSLSNSLYIFMCKPSLNGYLPFTFCKLYLYPLFSSVLFLFILLPPLILNFISLMCLLLVLHTPSSTTMLQHFLLA